MRELFLALARQLLEFGVDIRKLYSVVNIFRFILDVLRWRALGGKVNSLRIVLSDYFEPAGTAKGHYFHQDLMIAQRVFEHAPETHIDVGSRIDGFVAHVASFRKIKVIDVRPLFSVGHENIEFVQADLMAPVRDITSDSVSCLHALEHFGLGRYGDPLSVNGFEVGLKNICSIVQPEGRLYLSFPIGRSDSVVFNAHRIFDPLSIFDLEPIRSEFQLIDFCYVDDNGCFHKSVTLPEDTPSCDYGCGIYTFKKVSRVPLGGAL